MKKPRATSAPGSGRRATALELIPRRVRNPTIDDYLEIMTRAIFQAGLSWALIERRWPAFQNAFDRFKIARVAAYDAFDIDRLMTTGDIIHSQKKITGTIANANALLETQRTFGTLENYAASFRSYAEILADARGRFAFLGDLSCYYWLFRTGNAVPLFESWIADQPKDHPRMREMVLTGRAEAASAERAGF